MISHYFSYFSASAVRIFWHVAQWKGSKSTSKLCKSIFQNILAYGKSDILDSKMTCASGSPLRKISTTTTKISPPPIDEKLKGIPSLKKILSKKIGKIIKKLYLKLKKLLKKKLKKLFFLPTVSFHVFQHPQASPITWYHPPRVPPVPNFPSFLKCPSYEAASQDLGEHI